MAEASEHQQQALALRSGSTHIRTQALRQLQEEFRAPPSDKSKANAVWLVHLFQTYPLYHDRASRREVQAGLHLLLEQQPELFPDLVALISESSQLGGLSPSSALALVEQTCLALSWTAKRPEEWQRHGLALVDANARLLDLLHLSASRKTICKAADNVTRRTINRLLTPLQDGVSRLRSILSRLTDKSGLGGRSALMLHQLVKVANRGPSSDSESSLSQLHQVLVDHRSGIYDWWTREMVASKNSIPLARSSAISEVFAHFTSIEDLNTQLVPAYEKALLRSSETVLHDLITPLFSGLPESVDVSQLLSDRLLKPLTSCSKSTNVRVRDGALSALKVLWQHSHHDAAIDKALEELLAPLKASKLASADLRIWHCLAVTPVLPNEQRSRNICTTLQAIVSKETSEAALDAETRTLTLHLRHSLQKNYASVDSFVSLYVQGINQKKASMQRIWTLRCGELLCDPGIGSNSESANARAFGAVAKGLHAAFDYICANALPSLQAGTIVAAYVALDLFSAYQTLSPIAQGSAPQMFEKATRTLLGNPRIFSKLSSKEDYEWCLRAVDAAKGYVMSLEDMDPVCIAWIRAYFHLITDGNVPPPVRRQAFDRLSRAYIDSPKKVSILVIRGLWAWLHEANESSKIEMSLPLPHAGRLLDAIAPARLLRPENSAGLAADNIIVHQLRKMLVLCQPVLIPGVNWISFCVNARSDPGQIVAVDPQGVVDLVLSTQASEVTFTASASLVTKAACMTLVELCFVSPESITPLLIDQIQSNLNPTELETFTATDIAIAQASADEAYIDVLASKGTAPQLDKGASDYQTLKWEAEVRAQVAAKKKPQKKLTVDEQNRVSAQIAKEAEIRRRVQTVRGKILFGLGIIKALAEGPPTDTQAWLPPALDVLLKLVSLGVSRLVDYACDETILSLSSLLASRLGITRQFIAVAVLRTYGSTSLPNNLQEEPLAALVTRVQYRLRVMAESQPFDSLTLMFILPLLGTVLRNRGVGSQDDEAADEQVTLALELLEVHADIFANRNMPRSESIQILIQSLQNFPQHYRLVKDCFQAVVSALSQNVTEHEIAAILEGVIVPQTNVRTAVMQAIEEHLDLSEMKFSAHIFLELHDDADEVTELADSIWHENKFTIRQDDVYNLLKYLSSLDVQLRKASARGVAACVSQHASTFTPIVERLKNLYIAKAKPLVPELDAFGMTKKQQLVDPWEIRQGIGLTFQELASIWPVAELPGILEFLIDDGAFVDRNAVVRTTMIEAATNIVSLHGARELETLMRILEVAMARPQLDAQSDLLHEAVIIIYGTLARHLPSNDKRTASVVSRLLSTTSTPSETVQYAVAECLAPLVRKSPDLAAEALNNMLNECIGAKDYAARRGAAYGLAGIVNGRGISALHGYRIMTSLHAALEDKKDVRKRQGALFAYEILSLFLGLKFEPYVIAIVPQLILAFGDATSDVREACLDTAKTCFARLTSYGVKVILPILLDGLDETQWRSKRGACDLLGAMAYLDPQQLAMSLPDIIPPLTTVLNDSHKEVRAAANRSLLRFGEVISNPEIKSLVTVLLQALSDPTKHTDDALDALIRVSFVHYLDAPSLALVVRILERGLADRSNTKRKAAQIIGSLAHLTERKDLTTHLPILVAGLRGAAVDPVPTTRATASKALGSLIEKLGEETLPDLIPDLMNTLRADTGAGDRLGSAQALSEVLAGLGTTRLEETLPTILQNVASVRAVVREGFMSLFIYLPACFGNSFAAYLSKIIPPILAGLADEIEGIRETSLRAGRLLVKNFASKSIDLLLPELDRGLADDSYRIRLSSVELVGDLLLNLTGASRTEDDERDEDQVKEAGQSLLEVLGEEKRNKVLSSLYICRCDTSGLVRTAAIGVWKSLVASPRMLKELVPALSQTIIRRLASSNPEHKTIAGNALGELIKKAGDNVLENLLPTLEEGLKMSTDNDQKEGICVALREIIAAASPEVLEDYEKILIAIVRTALIDSDAAVRHAAAEAFDALQQILGKKTIDQVLPHLLHLLRSKDEASTALSALLTLLADTTRANVILPNLVPTLLVNPMSSFNARAIASLAQVAGTTLNRRLTAILTAMMDNILSSQDENLREEFESSFDSVLLSVDEYDGLNTTMSVMISMVKHEDHRRRANAAQRLRHFFAAAESDYSRYNQDLIRVLLLAFDDRDDEVVKSAWEALVELLKHLRKEEMETLVIPTRQVVQQVGVAGHDLKGFCLPKGINAVLPIFLQGLMNGTLDQRTQAALAISDIIDRTSAYGLKPFVTNITGPLIRVVSERSTDLKCAILLTLNNLLEKIPLFLKPFLPQLQRTFAKSLADPNSDLLRVRAAKALGTLLTLKPRIDPLIAELVTGTKTPDIGVKTAMLKALYEVVSKAGENMSEASRTAILSLIDDEVDESDTIMRSSNARLLGALVQTLPEADAVSLMKQRALPGRPSPTSVLNLNALLVEAPEILQKHFANELPSAIAQGISNPSPFIAENFILASGKYLLRSAAETSPERTGPIFAALASVIGPGAPVDARRLALVVVRTVSRQHNSLVHSQLSVLVPPVFASVRDMVIPIKLAAEATFVGLFDVVESESTVFDDYLAGPGTELSPTTKKSMQDYFKRVATRLAAQARERREAEGGAGGLGLSSDEAEDEREIWSVGKVELGDVFAKD